MKKIAKNVAAIGMSLVMSATAAMGSFSGYESFFNEIAVSAEASTEMTIKSVSKSDKIYKFSWNSVKGAYEYAMKHGRRNGSKYMNYYYGLAKVPADVYADSIRSVPNGNFGYMLYVE